MENILDDIDQPEIDSKKPITRLIQIFVGSIVLVILSEYTKGFLPKLLSDLQFTRIRTIALLLLFMTIPNAILFTKYLDQIQPKLSLIKVVVYSGLMMGMIYLILMFQHYFWRNIPLSIFELIRHIIGTAISAVLVMLFSNIRIHKLRNKSIAIPIFILIGVFIAFVFFMS